MSLGLQLRGILPSGANESTILEAIKSWFRDTCGSVIRKIEIGEENGSPALFVDLHPAAETLSIVLESSNIVASAQTSAVGPGYHVYVCDLLKNMSRKFDFAWSAGSDDEGDETGYFESGNQSSLNSENAGVAAGSL
jgi:hypothetical protein